MNHTCHWPGCKKEVPPKLWGCAPHWFLLPKNLRDKVWANYQVGQEVNKKPSKQYIEIAQEIQAWVISTYWRCDMCELYCTGQRYASQEYEGATICRACTKIEKNMSTVLKMLAKEPPNDNSSQT